MQSYDMHKATPSLQ